MTAVVANAQGEIHGRFTIPAGIGVGIKEVVFVGQSSRCQATFVGEGTAVLVDKRETITEHQQQVWQRRSFGGGDGPGGGGGVSYYNEWGVYCQDYDGWFERQ